MSEPTDPTEPPAVKRRRGGFVPVLVAGLAATALALATSGRTWATASTSSPGRREVVATGADVAPAMVPLALVALACWGAVLVLRTTGRRVVSVLGALASGGAAVGVVLAVGDAESVAADLLTDSTEVTTAASAWPWVAVAALVVALLTFVVAFVRCPAWPQMSRRYDRDSRSGAAATKGEEQPADLWRALDDGRDPTV